MVYIMPLSSRFKIGFGLVITLIIIPIIGMRNIFYLEVIFQISVFAALALGLNIVVGFTGLLNLGYVAFYLWEHTCGPFLARSSPSCCILSQVQCRQERPTS